jgi:hypothetical protein
VSMNVSASYGPRPPYLLVKVLVRGVGNPSQGDWMQICLGELDIGAAALGALVLALWAALVWARLDLVCLSSGALGGLAGHSMAATVDSGCLSSGALEDSVGPTMAAMVDSDFLSMGVLAVTGRLSLADTVATVDSVTDGIRKQVPRLTGSQPTVLRLKSELRVPTTRPSISISKVFRCEFGRRRWSFSSVCVSLCGRRKLNRRLSFGYFLMCGRLVRTS